MNADVYVNANGDLVGFNMFAYCSNNPANYFDPSGQDFDELFSEYALEEGGSKHQIGGLTQKLSNMVNEIQQKVGGKGSKGGIEAHKMLKEEVLKMGNPNVKSEISFKGGKEVSYGAKGSVRFDVALLGPDGKVVAAWDLKTGKAILTSSRIKEMQTISGFQDIPIFMLK